MIALLYVSTKQTNLKVLRYLSLFLKRFGCTLVVPNRHTFARSKMAAFQTKNRKHDIKNVAI